MTMHTSPRSYRGVATVRADASDPNKILAELQSAVKAMRDKNDEALKSKVEDVVLKEHVDRINASVGELQKALDEQAQKLSALNVNGGGDGKGRKIKDRDYSEAFNAHIKRGDVQASLNKGTAAEGGYTAPTEWDRTITDRLVLISPIRSVASVLSISSNGFSKLFNLKGTVSGWVGETAARPETAAPQLGTLTYNTGEIYANPSATQQMLDDSEIDLEAWLAGEVEQQFAYQEGLAFVSGTGANGRPNGVLTYVTGGANATAHPYGAITTVNSGHATQVTADGLINLVHALPVAYTGNARFAMNRSVQNAVRLLKDTTNNYLWQPSNQAGAPATLSGYPTLDVPDMPNLAAASKSILFGDFKQGYLVVDRMGVRVLRDPYSTKPYVLFYTTKRVGGGLLNPDAFKAMNTSA